MSKLVRIWTSKGSPNLENITSSRPDKQEESLLVDIAVDQKYKMK